jgi:hypothetical protein
LDPARLPLSERAALSSMAMDGLLGHYSAIFDTLEFLEFLVFRRRQSAYSLGEIM